MKKLLLALACFTATVGLMAQGFQPQINWANKIASAGVNFVVTDNVTGKPAGTDLVCGLWWSATENGTYVQAGAEKTFLLLSGQPSGYYATAAIQDVGPASDQAGTVAGGTAWFQLRAWSKGLTETAAQTTDGAKYGTSAKLQVTMMASAKDTPPTLKAMQGFAVNAVVIPEPSILALGLLGGAAFLLRRRS